MNCESLSFSQKLSEQRIRQAKTLLGKKMVRKVLAYALFLLGVNRSSISTFLNMAPGSIRSVVLAIKLRGLAGLEDQRSKASSFKPPRPEQIVPTLEADDSGLKVNFNVGHLLLRIPKTNPIQKRVVLLSLANSGLLERSTVAAALHLSIDRTGKLARTLEQEDVKGILTPTHTIWPLPLTTSPMPFFFSGLKRLRVTPIRKTRTTFWILCSRDLLIRTPEMSFANSIVNFTSYFGDL